jgi:hypothetical protein
LLLLNEDDGNEEYQTYVFSMMPRALKKRVHQCNIQEIDFGGHSSDPMWYIKGIKRDQTFESAWWSANADDQIKEYSDKSKFRVAFCTGPDSSEGGQAKFVFLYGHNGFHAHCNAEFCDRLSRIQKCEKEVHFVRLFHDDGYFVSDDEGAQWSGVGDHCANKLRNRTVEEIDIAKDKSWVVIFSDKYSCSSGIDEHLRITLNAFFARQRKRNQARAQEITEYYARIASERAEQLARERARVEQVAATEGERLVREEQELIEREAAEEERLRRQEEEEAAYRQQAEREAVARQELEDRLENHLLEEAKSISELESLLKNRKRTFQRTIVTLPPERRRCLQEILSNAAVSDSETTTVTYTNKIL